MVALAAAAGTTVAGTGRNSPYTTLPEERLVLVRPLLPVRGLQHDGLTG